MNPIKKFDLKAIAACAAVFAIVQGLLFGDIIGPFWELNIILICINIILATSLNLINGYTGQFSIGHAGFMAVGAYTSAIMTVKLVCRRCVWTATIWLSPLWAWAKLSVSASSTLTM